MGSRNDFARHWAGARPARLLDLHAGGRGLLVMGSDPGSARGQIWFVSYPKGEVSRFTNDLSYYQTCCLEVTRDGHSLLVLEDTHLSEVWIAKGDGSDAKQITSGQNLGCHLFWTGDRLAAANFEASGFG